MCGDVEDETGEAEERLYTQFLAHARALLEGGTTPPSSDPLAYMDKLCSDALARSVRDAEEAGPGKRYLRLASQPLVFARLAGLLAGHLARDQDPLRHVIEALMQGYAEAAEAVHRHDHEHGHDHDHGHHH
jgi:hypothetical protein